MPRKDALKVAGFISLIVISGFGMLVYSLLPELSDFRNSIYGTLVLFAILAGIILFLTLSREINMPFLGKITVWIYGLLFLVLGIFDFGRIEALFFFIYAIINVCVTVYLYQKYGSEFKGVWLFAALSYLKTITIDLRVKYINDGFNLTFLMPAIIVSTIIFVPCLIYGIRSFKLYRDWEKLIMIPLASLIFSFVFVWQTAASMNVYLDTSTPIYEEYIIIEKDVRTGARQITTYELEVQKEDTVFKIGVSETSYYSHEVNGTIKLSLYKGAFNEPYYIHESNEN